MTNWFVNNHSRYEKRNDTECCLNSGGPDIRVVRRRAGGDHNHNASNHGLNGSPATDRFADDDNNDPHRRLLIAKAGRG